MKESLVSIIIPAYNEENFLEETLKSVYSQTYENWECLIIDDGSKDKTAEISKSWCSKYTRFQYIYKENGGVSSARNLGIEKCKGEFICFVDADDWIEENYIKDYLTHYSNETTLLIQDFYKDIAGNVELSQNYKNEILLLPENMVEFLSNYLYTQGFPVNKFYSSYIIKTNGLKFKEHLSFCEDELFYFEYLRYIAAIQFLPNANYHYRINADSLSNSKDFTRTFTYMKEVFKDYPFFEKNCPDKKFIENYINQRKSAVFNLCFKNAIYQNNYTKPQRIEFLAEIRPYVKKFTPFKQKLTHKIDYLLLRLGFYPLLNEFIIRRIKAQG